MENYKRPGWARGKRPAHIVRQFFRLYHMISLILNTPKEIADTARKMGLETVRHGNGTAIKLTSPSVLSELSERYMMTEAVV